MAKAKSKPRTAAQRADRWNVEYDDTETGESRLYLACPTNRNMATYYRNRFADIYVGKQYPNGAGEYPYANPRVVPVSAQ